MNYAGKSKEKGLWVMAIQSDGNFEILDRLNKNELMPLYYQIGNQLKEQILSGRLTPGSKLPAEDSLARRYGVAKLTLRNALGKLAQEGLIKRLKGKGTFIADEISGREKIVSVIFDFHDQVMPSTIAKIISGIIMRLNKEKNFRIRVDGIEDLPQIISQHRAGEIRIDGAITVRLNEQISRIVPMLLDADIPFVAEGITGPYNSVEIDNRKSMKIAFRHLLELGHREIGIGTLVNYKNEHLLQRDEIARELLKKEFGGVHEEYCFNLKMDDPRLPMEKQAFTFLRGKHKPTALLCTCDVAALPLITQAPFAGIRIPEEFSVIGFDDMEACLFVYPGLTTIRQDYFQHGGMAAKLLIDKMHDCNHRQSHCRIVPELVVRGSCAPPPARQ
ncbi:MAG: Arabinose metabolism transcriptional repressor [Lentisphaerae bacterium ADurb.Bin242]|nr:MAG: Arabinose metabolism transcriptional repressor [Lentisphaerae bacterium ADurb.Bin242]